MWEWVWTNEWVCISISECEGVFLLVFVCKSEHLYLCLCDGVCVCSLCVYLCVFVYEPARVCLCVQVSVCEKYFVFNRFISPVFTLCWPLQECDLHSHTRNVLHADDNCQLVVSFNECTSKSCENVRILVYLLLMPQIVNIERQWELSRSPCILRLQLYSVFPSTL